MRVSYKDIIITIFKIILLIYMGYATLLGIPVLNDKGNARVLMSVLTILVFLLAYQKRYLIKIKEYTAPYFDRYIKVLSAVLVIHGIYGAVKYGQSTFDMYIVLIEYTFLLLVYPALMWLDLDETSFFNFVTCSTILLAFITIIKALFVNYLGINVIQTLHSSIRNGRVRITTPAICSILTIVLFYRVLNEKKKRIINIVLLLMLLSTLIWVDQTRMVIVSVLCGLGASVLAKKRQHPARTLIVYLVAAILIAVALNSGVLDSFMDSFSVNSKESSSTSVRLQAIEYFWTFFKDNPILGMGYIRPTSAELISIWSGPLKKFYLNDLGAIGLLCRAGLTSIIIYWIPLIRMFVIAFRALKYKITESSLLIGLVIYVAITSVSLIYTDQERLLWFGILMAIFEFYNVKMMKDKEQEIYS